MLYPLDQSPYVVNSDLNSNIYQCSRIFFYILPSREWKVISCNNPIQNTCIMYLLKSDMMTCSMHVATSREMLFTLLIWQLKWLNLTFLLVIRYDQNIKKKYAVGGVRTQAKLNILLLTLMLYPLDQSPCMVNIDLNSNIYQCSRIIFDILPSREWKVISCNNPIQNTCIMYLLKSYMMTCSMHVAMSREMLFTLLIWQLKWLNLTFLLVIRYDKKIKKKVCCRWGSNPGKTKHLAPNTDALPTRPEPLYGEYWFK